ncbi:MAG: MFS transporter [Alphaproteobacteria bacterium]|nr:MFS transporter [Alphaproteobacteria bacterium]OJV15759.1 MAG: hypothetical protein BGO27_07580 [Alphaproteobacteria bacterium 33-17]
MSFTKSNHRKLSAYLGVMVEHYDTALYGFMTPVLKNLFFPNLDDMTALIFMISGYGVSLLCKPFGALFFGYLGDKFGRKRALLISVLGMAMVTISMGILPTYETLGIFAPILLILCRAMQAFFVAGEYNGGAIYIIEHDANKAKGLASGIYCAFTAVGFLLASFATNVIIHYGNEYWRIPYYIASITVIVCIYFRMYAQETPEFQKSDDESFHEKHYNIEDMPRLFLIVALTSFVSALYMIPTVMVNSFITVVTTMDIKDVMKVNTVSLIYYTAFLPFAGMLTDKLGARNLMVVSLIGSIVMVFPAFAILGMDSIIGLLIFKCLMISLCAIFIVPFHPYSVEQFSVRQRYTNISFAYSIGSQVGAYAPTLSLSIYNKTGMIYTHGILIMVLAIIALYMMKSYERTNARIKAT